MALLMLILVAVCLVLVGAGMVLALVGVSCVAMLSVAGIVTSSAVTALLRRRISAGVRAFHYQVCTVVAAPAGVTLFWVLTGLVGVEVRLPLILLFGTLAGGSAGLMIAGISDWTVRIACRRINNLPAFTGGSPGLGPQRA